MRRDCSRGDAEARRIWCIFNPFALSLSKGRPCRECQRKIRCFDKLSTNGFRGDQLYNMHAKQLLTYLRLTGQPVGLLINFGGATLKEGVRRLVNDHQPSAPSRLRVSQ